MSDDFGLSEDVIAAALGDDEEAFCALIRASQADVRTVIRASVTDPLEVEDVLNATYMRVWEMREQLSVATIRPVLRAIAAESVEKRTRRSRRRQLVRKYLPWVPRESTPSTQDERDDLDHLMRMLPSDVAVAMEMKYVHGFALQQIANLLGVAIHDIQNRLNYGRTFLRIRALNEDW